MRRHVVDAVSFGLPLNLVYILNNQLKPLGGNKQ